MRVLFICGTGSIEKAIPVVQKKLNGAIELDTLSSLDGLNRYFAKGHAFEKCLVLSPDRLITNYTHDLLEGEMAKFKATIQAKCSANVDIVLCVTKEEDGMELAEQFSDMLGGMVTIIKVDEKLAMATLVDLIRQQGSTLAKKFKSYDLTALARDAAREIVKENNNTDAYTTLDDIMQQSQESVTEEGYITPLGTNSFDDTDGFNTNGFTPDTDEDISGTFDSGISDNFDAFNTNSNDSNIGMFDGLGDMDSGDIFGGDTNTSSTNFGGIGGGIEDATSMFEDNFGSNGSGVDASDFDMMTPFETNEDNNTATIFDVSRDKKDSLQQDLEAAPKKPVSKKKPTTTNATAAGNDLGMLAGLASGGAANQTAKTTKSGGLFGNKKQADTGNQATKPAKSGGLFGNKKSATVTAEEDEDSYDLQENKPVKPAKSGGMGMFSSKKQQTQEVSKKKNVGLGKIAKQDMEDEFDNDMYTSQEEEENTDVIAGTGVLLAQEDSARERASQSDDPISSMFEMDSSTKKEIAKGSGTGLNPQQLSAGRKKAGKKVTKELQELLKPYLKRGGLFIVTGSNGTGKTVISANLANLLCRSGYRVCVLDLDLQGKGQSYLNLDTFRTVHGGFQQKMNSVNVVNSTGTDFAKWTDVIRSGYHMITTTLNSDVEETHNLVRNKNMGRLVRQLISSYNFVIVDVGFRDLVNYYKDFADMADALICVEEATQRGLTNFMLNMINIEDEDVENTMFSRVSLVLNKEDGMKSFFGRKVNSTSDILATLDDTVVALAQQIIDYSFTEIPVISILKYSNAYERFWYTNKYITDTKEGEKLFSDLLQNALNN